MKDTALAQFSSRHGKYLNVSYLQNFYKVVSGKWQVGKVNIRWVILNFV